MDYLHAYRRRCNPAPATYYTAHTLRHTAATWLRQATGDARLVAEYLGHAGLSTVSRYAHVAREEMHTAVQMLADQAGVFPTPPDPLAGDAEVVRERSADSAGVA